MQSNLITVPLPLQTFFTEQAGASQANLKISIDISFIISSIAVTNNLKWTKFLRNIIIIKSRFGQKFKKGEGECT